MEMKKIGNNSIAAAFCIIFFVMLWRVLNWVWLKPKKLEKRLREEGFKGDSYRFVYGGLRDVSAMIKEAISKPLSLSDDFVPRVIPHLLHTINKHGKGSFMWFGVKPWVLITSPELIKEVTLNIHDFPKPASFLFFKSVAQGIARENGDIWARHKKIISPAFHQDKLKHMFPSFLKCASEMLSKWEEIVATEGYSEVNIWPYLQTLSSDAISRTAFGSNYEEGRRIFELQREQILYCRKGSLRIPGWRFLPTMTNRRMKRIAKMMNDSIMSMMSTRMNKIKAVEEGGEDDLLSLLLKEIDEQGRGKSGNDIISIQDVVENCKLFYFAGQETTAVLLVWTMVLLSRFPQWQNLAREEVLQVFGTNVPEFDGLNHLKIVTMILYEVLRLYPPVSHFLRTTTHETKCGNITLPAGVQLALPVMLMHHDSELWGEDVKEFKPERFAEGILKATKGQLIYFPFGWGPRICIGQTFSLIEAKMAMAMILQRFSFQLSPFYVHAPYSALTVQPQYGAHLILHKL